MLRFTIRGLLVLTLMAGLCSSWLAHHKKQAEEIRGLKESVKQQAEEISKLKKDNLHLKYRWLLCPTSPPVTASGKS